jgi:hypothetical protein
MHVVVDDDDDDIFYPVATFVILHFSVPLQQAEYSKFVFVPLV